MPGRIWHACWEKVFPFANTKTTLGKWWAHFGTDNINRYGNGYEVAKESNLAKCRGKILISAKSCTMQMKWWNIKLYSIMFFVFLCFAGNFFPAQPSPLSNEGCLFSKQKLISLSAIHKSAGYLVPAWQSFLCFEKKLQHMPCFTNHNLHGIIISKMHCFQMDNVLLLIKLTWSFPPTGLWNTREHIQHQKRCH